MYDNIDISPPRGVFVEVNSIADNITVSRESLNADGSVALTGNVGNMRVTVTDRGRARIYGSLAKYGAGHSCSICTHSDNCAALDRLADALQCDLTGWRVKELEFGATYDMNAAPTDYFPWLGMLYGQLPTPEGNSTIYYNTGNVSVKIYDKGMEAAARNEIPYNLVGRNLLRYEYRTGGDVAAAVGWPAPIMVSTLYNTDFYACCLNKYLHLYDDIMKRGEISTMERPATPKDVDEAALTLLAAEFPDIYDYIFSEQMKHAALSESGVTRLKRKLRTRLQAARRSELEKELTDKVNNVANDI